MYYGKNVLSKFPEKFVFSLNDADADALIPGVSVAALTGNTVYYTDSVKDTCQVKPYVFPEIEDLAWFVSAEPAKKAYAAKEYETALRLYEELAEKGFARAQFECGWIYYNGKGTPPNLEAALRWFEKAAALEHKDAQFRCAQMYYNGEGTAPNQAKALHWYEKAAMQGHKDAQFECGKLYHHGKGVAHDMGKAVDWFQKAAQQGIVKAMYNLAVMYYNGDGMPTDMKAAYTCSNRRQTGTMSKLSISALKCFIMERCQRTGSGHGCGFSASPHRTRIWNYSGKPGLFWHVLRCRSMNMDAPVLLLWNGRKKEGEYLEWQMFPWKRRQ